MTDPHKPKATPTSTSGYYHSILPDEDTPPQGSRRPHSTPAAGVVVPSSSRERPAPPSVPREGLRGLGSNPDEPPRSVLYAEAIKAAPNEVARWGVSVEWTGRLLDGQDANVKLIGNLTNAISDLRSAVAPLRALPDTMSRLESAIDAVAIAAGCQIGTQGSQIQQLTSAGAGSAARVVQLETALHEALSELGTIKRELTTKQASVAGGVGTTVAAIIGIIMYLTGHWK